MEREIKGRLLVETFTSLQEFCDVAAESAHISDSTREMVRNGWALYLPVALEIAESVVVTSLKLHEASAFVPAWDVSGAEVDVARYLSGEPECMIDFPLRQTVTAGRVITLVSSADANAGSDWLSRGILATALGLALARMGYATEMWADNYGYSHGTNRCEQYQRILIKSTSDEIDPARLMFAFGNNEMLVELAFGVFDSYKKLGPDYGRWHRGFGNSDRGGATPRTAELEALYPEGTIFLTGQLSGATAETAKAAVEAELHKLGLIDE
jgi:hypothetical protein